MNGEATERAGIRLLRPEDTRIFRGTFRMLHVTVQGEALYRGVFAVQAFPVSSPLKYVSLFYYDEEEKIREIGMIEDLSIFPPETAELVTAALQKYYYAREITELRNIRREFGMLFFDVETDQGPMKFALRWEQNSAVDFGKNGKMLLDMFEDRYIIRDLDELSRREREMFTRFIYW